MTNVAISGLPAASALTGNELVPVVQSAVTSQTTISAISDLLLGTYIDARNYAIDATGVADSSVGGNLAIIDAICEFGGTSVANVPSHVGLTIDAFNGGYAKFLDCWMDGGVFERTIYSDWKR